MRRALFLLLIISRGLLFADTSYNCGLALGFPPYQYQNSSLKPSGFDFEVSQALFKTAGLKVSYTQEPWDDILFSIMNHEKKIDILCGVEINDLRKKALEFTIPYYSRKIAIFVKKYSDINKVDDLLGKTITGDRHSSVDALLEKNSNKIRIRQTKTKEESFTFLKDSKVDAVIAPLEVGVFLSKEMNIPIKTIYISDSGTPVAFAVKKGDSELLKKLNLAMKDLIDKKIIEKLYAKYK